MTPSKEFPIEQKRGDFGNLVLVHLLFVLLALIFTCPLCFYANDVVPSLTSLRHWVDGDSDVWLFLWNMWWIEKALCSDELSVFETQYIFYPDILSLKFHSFSLANSLIGFLGVKFSLDRIFMYNFLFLLSYYLSGLFMYLLICRMGFGRVGAIIGGIIYAYCPYHVLHSLEHLNLMSIQWLPLCFYFYFRFKDDGRHLFFFILGMGAVAINLLISFYYGLMIVLLLGLHMFVVFVLKEERIQVQRKSIYFFTGACLTVLGIYFFLFQPTGEGKDLYTVNIEEMSYYSVDLATIFLPNPLHPFWGSWCRNFLESFPGNFIEIGVSPGLTVYFLVLLSLFRISRKVTIWLILGVIFTILSFGPWLMFHGEPVHLGDYKILLPGSILAQLPFFEHFRAPARWMLLATFCFSILSASAIHEYLSRTRKGGMRSTGLIRGLIVFIASLLLFEFWVAPFPLLSTRVSSIYERIGSDKRHFSVMEVPLDPLIRKYLYTQTVHQKPILAGYLARLSVKYATKFKRDRTFRFFAFREKPRFIKPPEEVSFLAKVREYDIGYLVIHRQYLGPDRLASMISFINSMKDRVVFDDDELIVLYFPEGIQE